MAFEPLVNLGGGTQFKFVQHGDSLEGYYLGSYDHDGDYGPTKKHLFQTETGNLVVFGQRALIDDLPRVKLGTMVRVTYNDDRQPKKKGRQPTKLFLIEQDKSNTITVDVAPSQQQNSQDYDDQGSDTDVDSDDTAMDEVKPTRAGNTGAKVASDEAQRKREELLKGRRTA